MSRCFPFPPPGYEKRARIDDTDLLTKEKQKEKKHKKDKKDKEKREGKEKKNKDKHKEKKDRKDKHKEKKDKDRDKDKDKTQTSADKKAEKQPECYNGEIKDSKYVEELARRIKDEDRAIGSQMVQNSVTDQRRVVLPEKVVESNIAKLFKEGEKIKDEKKINGFRNHIDTRILENESSGMDHARVDGKAKPADQNNVEKKMEAKERSKQNGGDGKGEKHKDRDKEKRSKSKDKDRKREKEKKEKVKKTEQSKELPKLKEPIKDMNSTCIANLGVLKEVETKKEPSKELGSLNLLKEGTKSWYGEEVLGKRKELEMKKEPISKDISKDMPVISNIKLSNHVKEVIKSSNGEGNLGKRKELEMNDMPVNVISNIKLSNHVKEGIKSSNGEGILGKRKEPDMNGVSNDNGTWSHKSPRLVSSLHPTVENGKKKEPEPSQIAEQVRVEIKGQRINGLMEAQEPKVSSKRPSHGTATLQVNENGELCGKSPHPDSKYLNQILSIPKIEELSVLDDQEWLFSSNNLQSKKPKIGSFEDKPSQVWAKARHILSADIYALPYVIPY